MEGDVVAGRWYCDGEEGEGAEVMNALFDDKIALGSLFGDGVLLLLRFEERVVDGCCCWWREGDSVCK
jgi:hypothetical protein